MGQCMICEVDKQLGIHLYKAFICIDCERKLVRTEVKEAVYREYVRKLKDKNQFMLYL